mgnify:CR=1 FL=1
MKTLQGVLSIQRCLLAQVTQPGQPHVQALQLITYIGCGLSLLGEILTVVAIICLK